MRILASSEQPVLSVPLALGFEARSLQVLAVEEGDFLRQDGAGTSFTSRIDPSGQVLMTVTRAGKTGAAASGVLATLRLRAVAPEAEPTRLRLLTIAPMGEAGRPVPAARLPPLLVRVTP